MSVPIQTTRHDRAGAPADVPAGYRRTEIGIIPEDWQLQAVGQMGDVLAGKALAARAPGEQRPYLRTKNVFDGRIDLEDVLTMPMTDAEFARYRLKHGDVLLNEGQSLELVGRCAPYGGEFGAPCAIQNQLIRFRALDRVSSGFAAHLFRHCQRSGVFARIAMQTTSVAHLGVSHPVAMSGLQDDGLDLLILHARRASIPQGYLAQVFLPSGPARSPQTSRLTPEQNLALTSDDPG